MRKLLIILALLAAPAALASDVALLRSEVYTAVKQLGVEPEVLAPAMERLAEEAAAGSVDEASIQDVTATIADYDVAMKVETLLRGFAETAAFGVTIGGALPIGLEHATAAAKQLRSGPRRIPGEIDPLEPANGGSCLTCPSFDFGPFTPTPTWQYHVESTDTNADCNWYQFGVTVGRTYEFSLCPADGADALFDSQLDLYDVAGCILLTSNDDWCGLQSRITWLATTSFVNLRVRGSSPSGGPPWPFGGYTLGYRELPCTTCAAPDPTTLFPTTACQIASGNVTSPCANLFYTVSLVAGSTYEFSTCPLQCSGSNCTTVADTVIELYAPGSVACTSGAGDRLAFNDDASPPCSAMLTRSRLTYIPAVSGLFKIKARAFNAATTGTICMSYRQLAAGCGSTCATGPFAGAVIPTSTCQTVSGSIALPCTDAWYLVSARAAGVYEFTTCSFPCPGGSIGGIDSILELYDASCALVGSDNDGCGAPRSNLTLRLPTPGMYRLRVRSASGTAGTFTVAHRYRADLCAPPAGVAIRPSSGIADSALGSCAVSQTFDLTAWGSSPMSYLWTITPPAGGIAVPPSGMTTAAPGSTNPAFFLSTLIGDGFYVVNVTATNACGSSSRTISYQVRDLTAPVFTSFPADTTVECGNVPPPAAVSASDNCDGNPVESLSETTTPGSCPGNSTITRTWTATDRSGNVSPPRSQTITVLDRTPPSIVPDFTEKYCMYPPNHELGCFTTADFSPVILEGCSPPVTWRFAGVLNSEEGFAGPCPPGDLDPDSTIGPGGADFCVRAERCGTDPAIDDGRVYLVFATATDACGNTSSPTAIGAVVVPHDSADTSACFTP